MGLEECCGGLLTRLAVPFTFWENAVMVFKMIFLATEIISLSLHLKPGISTFVSNVVSAYA